MCPPSAKNFLILKTNIPTKSRVIFLSEVSCCGDAQEAEVILIQRRQGVRNVQNWSLGQKELSGRVWRGREGLPAAGRSAPRGIPEDRGTLDPAPRVQQACSVGPGGRYEGPTDEERQTQTSGPLWVSNPPVSGRVRDVVLVCTTNKNGEW